MSCKNKKATVVVQCYRGPADGAPMFLGAEELRVGLVAEVEHGDQIHRYILILDDSERYRLEYIFPTEDD